MSINQIPAKEKLIVALDFPDVTAAKAMVERLGEEVVFYKIGLELLMSGDYFSFLEYLAKKNKKVFADLKLHDIANTTAKAIKNLSNYSNIVLTTIHTTDRITMAEVAKNKGAIKVVAVTILTNIAQNDLVDLGFDKNIELQSLVLRRAKLAKECGLDGVVASGLEASIIRSQFGANFFIVSPGIRIEKGSEGDQKRTVDVETAVKNGVDYLVVGRPITSAADPALITNLIQQQIKDALC